MKKLHVLWEEFWCNHASLFTSNCIIPGNFPQIVLYLNMLTINCQYQLLSWVVLNSISSHFMWMVTWLVLVFAETAQTLELCIVDEVLWWAKLIKIVFCPWLFPIEASLLLKLQTCRAVLPPYEEVQSSKAPGLQQFWCSQSGRWVLSSLFVIALSCGNSWNMTKGNFGRLLLKLYLYFLRRALFCCPNWSQTCEIKGYLALACWKLNCGHNS